MRFPGLRPATVISYAIGLILNAPENASFPQKAIYSVTIFSFSTFILLYGIRLTCWDATKFLNEATAFSRRETDVSLQGTGILERFSLKIRSMRIHLFRRYTTNTILSFVPSHHVHAIRTQFVIIAIISRRRPSLELLRWLTRRDCRAWATRKRTRSTGTGNFDERIKYKDSAVQWSSWTGIAVIKAQSRCVHVPEERRLGTRLIRQRDQISARYAFNVANDLGCTRVLL